MGPGSARAICNACGPPPATRTRYPCCSRMIWASERRFASSSTTKITAMNGDQCETEANENLSQINKLTSVNTHDLPKNVNARAGNRSPIWNRGATRSRLRIATGTDRSAMGRHLGSTLPVLDDAALADLLGSHLYFRAGTRDDDSSRALSHCRPGCSCPSSCRHLRTGRRRDDRGHPGGPRQHPGLRRCRRHALQGVALALRALSHGGRWSFPLDRRHQEPDPDLDTRRLRRPIARAPARADPRGRHPRPRLHPAGPSRAPARQVHGVLRRPARLLGPGPEGRRDGRPLRRIRARPRTRRGRHRGAPGARARRAA